MNAVTIADTENLPYADWLELRRKGIGGSDVSAVCGINKYKSPVELFMEKTGRLPSAEQGDPAYWGTILEPVVRSEFTKRTGIEVHTVKQLLQSNAYPFMQANLNGVCNVPEYGECIFEAKTASAFKTAEWENSIPDEYMLQIQHYMAVTGYKAAYIAVLIGGNTFRCKLIERDDELISMIVELEKKFWDCVQNDTPIAVDGSEASAKFLAERFSKCRKEQIELPENAVEIIERYNSACGQIAKFTEQKTLAENQLKELLGEYETGIAGTNIVSWKEVSAERLDSKTLKAEHPALYKKYANTAAYRRFSVKTND